MGQENRSPLDLFVPIFLSIRIFIADSPEPRYRRAAPLYGALSDILAPMDIMIYRPEEVQEWSQVPQAFVTTALRVGKVLYENEG